MSQGRENNQRKRKQTDSSTYASLFSNLMGTISTFIQRPFIDWFRKRKEPDCSNNDSDQSSEEIAPPPKKKKCYAIGRYEPSHPYYEDGATNDDIEDDTEQAYDSNEYNNDSQETRNSRKIKSPDPDDVISIKSPKPNAHLNQSSAYPHLSSSAALHKRATRAMASIPSGSSTTSPSTTYEIKDIDWSLSIQRAMKDKTRENSPTLTFDNSLDSVRSRIASRLVEKSYRTSSSRTTNYYKTRDLHLSSQANIMLVKNNSKRVKTTPKNISTSATEPKKSGPEPSGVPGQSELSGQIKLSGPNKLKEPSELPEQSKLAAPSKLPVPSELSEPREVPELNEEITQMSQTSNKNQLETNIEATKKESPSNMKEVSEQNKSDDPFTKLILASRDKWECSVCLVRNDRSLTKCGCCGGPAKGHSNLLPSEQTPVPKFNFGIKNTSTFLKTTNNSPFIITPQQKSNSDKSPVSHQTTKNDSFLPMYLPSISKVSNLSVVNENSLQSANLRVPSPANPAPTLDPNPAPPADPSPAPTADPSPAPTPVLNPAPIPNPNPAPIPNSNPAPILTPTPNPNPIQIFMPTPESNRAPIPNSNPAPILTPTPNPNPTQIFDSTPEPNPASILAPTLSSTQVPAVHAFTAAPTAAPTPVSPLITSSSPASTTISSIIGNSYLENSKFIFGTPNVNINSGIKLGSGSNTPMTNAFGMQMPTENQLTGRIGVFGVGNAPANQTNSAPLFSSSAPHVNIFGSSTASVNTLSEHVEPRQQTGFVFGMMPKATPTFEQPAPRPPAAGPVFSFGQPQPMQTQPQPMHAQPLGVQPMSMQPMGSQHTGLQSMQSSVYNFAGSQSMPQFNMGSSPTTHTTTRKVRRAVRRNNVR